MAQIDSGGSGRSTNFELNLVPFIDLMSVMITFLLITAVWNQISMIQIGSSIYGKKTNDAPAEPPPKADIPLRVDVRTDGYRLVVASQTIAIPLVNGRYDQPTLKARLEQVKASYPDKQDGVVTAQDSVVYNEIIGGMDMLLQAGFPSVSIATGGAQ